MKVRLLPAAMGVAAAAALAAASLALAGSTTLHLTAKDNGKSFSVMKGSAVVVTLQSCHDCGYQWKRGPSSGVKLVSHRYVQHLKKGQVGGMGKEIWRFTVTGSKSIGKIQLRYISPAMKVTKRFKVGLNIS